MERERERKEISTSDGIEESNKFLGQNTSAPEVNQLIFIEEVVDRIKSWTIKGLSGPEEKDKLLRSTQRTGQINHESPKLNDEVFSHDFSLEMNIFVSMKTSRVLLYHSRPQS